MAAQGCARCWLSLPALLLLLACVCFFFYKLVLLHRDKNCTAIWEAFRAVLDKEPCAVLPSDYDLFISLSRHSIPQDKSLFWENNQFLVTSYAENARRFMPLQDVLYGRAADLLSWCRQENASGEHPAQGTRKIRVPGGCAFAVCAKRFQMHLSHLTVPASPHPLRCGDFISRGPRYSKDSSGVIHVMLNGSVPTGAYPVKGFFADFEVPYFQKDKITRIEIWVMHEIGGPNVESCGEGSVKILEERLKEMGFQYSCINDYLPVKLLKCVDHSTHADCALNSAAASTLREVPFLYAEQSASLVVPLLVALAAGAQM
ncbi:ADP-ribosyl cyclase/cyclic ADP-ribose hydrolase 2 [Pteropus medius]|uniref:ADP-ribosyl cyclase/cyclic ADP-ribose hydrolase 2 n=1 Tax=Pteropus vampyrus TaxID=132908 RepID=UPI00196AD66A|nr:ADP-ribosyl cyclase/cyclic ADP-ribose hydrolase 2 [Pteropus giganteus]